MAKGPLRIALEDFVTTGPWSDWLKDWIDRFNKRALEANDLYINAFKVNDVGARVALPVVLIYSVWYEITGDRSHLDKVLRNIQPATAASPSQLLGDALESVAGSSEVLTLTKLLGAFAYDPIAGVLEANVSQADVDPKEFARSFTGTVLGLQAIGGVANTTVEAATAGAVKGVGTMFESVFWSLGLGFLGWQVLSPLLQSGLLPNLDRYYLDKARPKRFGATDLRDLYAAGKITREALAEEARFIGWRDQDINLWIDLAYRHIGEGDIWNLYNRGKLTGPDVTARLSALGYAASEIPYLFQANSKPDIANDEVASVALLKAAYKDGIITAIELRSNLDRMHYTEREINLIIAVVDASKHQANVNLSVGQVKEAWKSNIIADAEVAHWLAELQIPASNAAILLETWKAEAAPKFSKLNRGTITAAYVFGVINRGQASAKLQSVGLTQGDAALELDLAEARNPEAFGHPKPKPPKELTPTIILALVRSGTYTVQQAIAKLIANRYTPEDAAAIGQLAASQLRIEPKPLSKTDVLNAYVAKVITTDEAENKLFSMGFTKPDTRLLISTTEREHPEVFGPTPDPKPKPVTLGQLTALLKYSLITTDRLHDRLIAEGYSPSDAELFTQLAVNVTEPVAKGVTPSLVQRAYISSVINRDEAVKLLEGLDYTSDAIETLLSTIEAENPAVFAPETVLSIRQPTVGALVAAYQGGIISDVEFYARMAEIGYDKAGADIYIALAASRDGKTSRTLTVSEIQSAYRQLFFSHGVALDRLSQLGYNDDDATMLLRFVRSGIEDTETWRNMLAGLLSAELAYQQLIAAGFTQAEIDKAILALQKGTPNAQG